MNLFIYCLWILSHVQKAFSYLELEEVVTLFTASSHSVALFPCRALIHLEFINCCEWRDAGYPVVPAPLIKCPFLPSASSCHRCLPLSLICSLPAPQKWSLCRKTCVCVFISTWLSVCCVPQSLAIASRRLAVHGIQLEPSLGSVLPRKSVQLAHPPLPGAELLVALHMLDPAEEVPIDTSVSRT